jgi:hypothetical protein
VATMGNCPWPRGRVSGTTEKTGTSPAMSRPQRFQLKNCQVASQIFTFEGGIMQKLPNEGVGVGTLW